MNPQPHSKNSSSNDLLLVIDAGTTNIKAFVFDQHLNIVDTAKQPTQLLRPMPDWVEQDPMLLYGQVVDVIKQVGQPYRGRIKAIGLTGQRESTVIWDSQKGEPLYPIISWQDNRTADFCRDIAHIPAHRTMVREKTGLFIQPYFSAAKLHWLLNTIHTLGAQTGTVDSWLLYKLTNEHHHLTDYTNASRTLLFNIKTLEWDDELLKLFGIPRTLLPQAMPSLGDFGTLDRDILGEPIPIRAVIGDQQASLYAAGTEPGSIKITYGTGIFAMKLLEDFELHESLLTTLAVGDNNSRQYALEGSVKTAAERIAPLLDTPRKLKPILRELAFETSAILQLMLDHQRYITIDGGMSNDKELRAQQEAFLEGISLVRQRHTEGTAYGVAKLMQSEVV